MSVRKEKPPGWSSWQVDPSSVEMGKYMNDFGPNGQALTDKHLQNYEN